MNDPEATPLANPRRPSLVPWKVGLLIDWAFATDPIKDYADAITLAFEEARAQALIDRDVELVVRKVYGGPNASAHDVLAAFRELAYEGRVHAIIGPTLPDDMMMCRHEIDRAQVPIVSFGGTLGISSPWLFQLPNGTYVDEIRMIVNHARAAGHTSIALLRDMSMMGDEYAATFQLAAREAGIRVAAVQAIRPGPSQAEITASIEALRESGADALLIITVAVHRNFVNALEAACWSPAKLMVCNFVGSLPGFDGPEAFEGWVGIDQYDESNPVFMQMADSFERRFGRKAGHTYQAIGYDIGRTLARAFAMMAPSTPEGLRDAIEKVRMLPAAAGRKGTVVSFSKNDRRGYKGDYLVYRTVEDGMNKVIGGLSDHVYP